MTETEVLAMRPGIELNRQVAEQVMEHVVTQDNRIIFSNKPWARMITGSTDSRAYSRVEQAD